MESQPTVAKPATPVFRLHSQYVDSSTGMHVMELRNGNAKHIVQIAVGHDACPMCGVVYPKENGAIDPAAILKSVSDGLNQSAKNVSEYAQKHGLRRM